jgi:hypothetical protein
MLCDKTLHKSLRRFGRSLSGMKQYSQTIALPFEKILVKKVIGSHDDEVETRWVYDTLYARACITRLS